MTTTRMANLRSGRSTIRQSQIVYEGGRGRGDPEVGAVARSVGAVSLVFF